MCTFWTLCSHELNQIYPGKSLKTSFVSPGKPWNLVFASHGKSWKTVVYCLYEPWIKKQFGVLTVEEFKILYKTCVRQHLEYCIEAWSPYLEKDFKCLEKFQRRATNME